MFNCIPANWTVVIREVGEHHFIDEMLKGPMAAFRHEHRVAVSEGGTLYTDRVTYAAIGGAPLEWLVVDAYMRRIFQARHFYTLRRWLKAPVCNPVEASRLAPTGASALLHLRAQPFFLLAQFRCELGPKSSAS